MDISRRGFFRFMAGLAGAVAATRLPVIAPFASRVQSGFTAKLGTISIIPPLHDNVFKGKPLLWHLLDDRGKTPKA